MLVLGVQHMSVFFLDYTQFKVVIKYWLIPCTVLYILVAYFILSSLYLKCKVSYDSCKFHYVLFIILVKVGVCYTDCLDHFSYLAIS